MTFTEVDVRWSVILADRFGPEVLNMLEVKGQVLHREQKEIGGLLSRTPTRCRKKGIDASKPVTRHFNLPDHSHHNMTICAYP